jgi:hypothetical protein
MGFVITGGAGAWGRPFIVKGRSGNRAGRQPGLRNRATLAAAALLAGEAEALTRKAVELALGGDAVALRLCIERILPPCRERTVKFALPPAEGTLSGQPRGVTAQDISTTMNAVSFALAEGVITPDEAERIAIAVDSFARAIDTIKRREFAVDLLQILGFRNFDESLDCDREEADVDASE